MTLTADSKMMNHDVLRAHKVRAEPTVVTHVELTEQQAARIRRNAMKHKTRRRTWKGEPIGPDFFKVPGKEGLRGLYQPMTRRLRETLDGWGRRVDAVEFAVGRYSNGQFLAWHLDGTTGDGVHVRSGCASWQVSAGEDYEGGDLESGVPGVHVETAPRQRGTLVVFDPMTWHRVTPITSGERWAVIVCAYTRIGGRG